MPTRIPGHIDAVDPLPRPTADRQEMADGESMTDIDYLFRREQGRREFHRSLRVPKGE